MPDLCCPFIGDGTLERLLLYRESRQDDNSSVVRTGDDLIMIGGGGCNGDASSTSSSAASTLAGISRFAVLSFLENVMQNNALQSSSSTSSSSSGDRPTTNDTSTTTPSSKLAQSLSQLVTSLVALNRRKEFIAPAMIGTEFYGKKLRCWQALCILSRILPREDMIGGDVVPILFHTLSHNNGHSIRVSYRTQFLSLYRYSTLT